MKNAIKDFLDNQEIGLIITGSLQQVWTGAWRRG